MKKILVIGSMIILIAIIMTILYSSYAETRLNEYLKFIPSTIERFMGTEITNLEIERVIKKSPREIIILVKWDGSSAFICIKDWLLPRAHDEMEIRVFDSKKSMKVYE